MKTTAYIRKAGRPPVPIRKDRDPRYEQVHWRLPVELVDQLRDTAAREQRTIVTEAVRAITRGLEA